MMGGSRFEESISLTEPFHGPIWLGVSRESSAPVVRLAVSIDRGWDVDVSISVSDVSALVGAFGGREPRVVVGETADSAAAVLVAGGDRLAVIVLEDRLSDVLTLGTHTQELRSCLTAAAQLSA